MGKSGDIIDSPLTAEGVEMYSLNGRFNNRLDDKNRIRIPAKFKADLGANYKFAFGPGESIYVMPEKEYQKILDGFGEVSFFDEEAQNAIASFTGMVYDVTEDAQGRVLVPAELKEYAQIDKDVVITGAAAFVRIESAEKFAKRMSGMNISSVFAKLNSLHQKKKEQE